MSNKWYRFASISLLICIGLIITGCASVISKNTMKGVDESLTFEQMLEEPEAYMGRTVLLGGDIISTENRAGKTLIFVLQRPLTYRDKPTSEDLSKGRFIISAPGFLDPAIYRAGRKVTVAGALSGKEVRKMDEIDYTYPVISQKELYLWPLEESDTQPRVRFGIGIGIGL